MSQPFPNAVVGGGGQLVIPQIRSPNYVPGSAGWAIKADGTAEFNNVTIRGQLIGTTSFSYSGAPAAGNLVQTSGLTTAGTDGFGNHYLGGQATYSAAFAIAVIGGAIIFFTGSLAGGWTQAATIETDLSGDLALAANGIVILDGTGGNQASGNFNCTATYEQGGNPFYDGTTLTVNGSTDTGTALPAGVPTGGPNGGVFAGHTHDFDGHTHPL